MSQTSYNLYQPAAHVGLLYDIEPHRIVTGCAEGGIRYGSAVIPGTDPLKQVRAPDPAGLEHFRGIALSTWAKEQNNNGEGEYITTDAVNVLKQGLVWVEVNGNVAIDGAAYFVITAGIDNGKFRGDDTGAEIVPTGVFRTSANSGEIVLIEINLP